MTDPQNAPAPLQWAEVRVREQVIRYRRAGRGRGCLVLVLMADPDDRWPGLLDALARRYRVFHPEPPLSGLEPGPWLDALLEGLGMSDIVVFADEPFGAVVMASPSRDEIAAVMMVGPYATPAGNLPLLTLDPAAPTEETVERIAEFVDGVI